MKYGDQQLRDFADLAEEYRRQEIAAGNENPVFIDELTDEVTKTLSLIIPRPEQPGPPITPEKRGIIDSILAWARENPKTAFGIALGTAALGGIGLKKLWGAVSRVAPPATLASKWTPQALVAGEKWAAPMTSGVARGQGILPGMAQVAPRMMAPGVPSPGAGPGVLINRQMRFPPGLPFGPGGIKPSVPGTFVKGGLPVPSAGAVGLPRGGPLTAPGAPTPPVPGPISVRGWRGTPFEAPPITPRPPVAGALPPPAPGIQLPALGAAALAPRRVVADTGLRMANLKKKFNGLQKTLNLLGAKKPIPKTPVEAMGVTFKEKMGMWSNSIKAVGTQMQEVEEKYNKARSALDAFKFFKGKKIPLAAAGVGLGAMALPAEAIEPEELPPAATVVTGNKLNIVPNPEAQRYYVADQADLLLNRAKIDVRRPRGIMSPKTDWSDVAGWVAGGALGVKALTMGVGGLAAATGVLPALGAALWFLCLPSAYELATGGLEEYFKKHGWWGVLTFLPFLPQSAPGKLWNMFRGKKKIVSGAGIVTAAVAGAASKQVPAAAILDDIFARVDDISPKQMSEAYKAVRTTMAMGPFGVNPKDLEVLMPISKAMPKEQMLKYIGEAQKLVTQLTSGSGGVYIPPTTFGEKLFRFTSQTIKGSKAYLLELADDPEVGPAVKELATRMDDFLAVEDKAVGTWGDLYNRFVHLPLAKVKAIPDQKKWVGDIIEGMQLPEGIPTIYGEKAKSLSAILGNVKKQLTDAGVEMFTLGGSTFTFKGKEMFYPHRVAKGAWKALATNLLKQREVAGQAARELKIPFKDALKLVQAWSSAKVAAVPGYPIKNIPGWRKMARLVDVFESEHGQAMAVSDFVRYLKGSILKSAKKLPDLARRATSPIQEVQFPRILEGTLGTIRDPDVLMPMYFRDAARALASQLHFGGHGRDKIVPLIQKILAKDPSRGKAVERAINMMMGDVTPADQWVSQMTGALKNLAVIQLLGIGRPLKGLSIQLPQLANLFGYVSIKNFVKAFKKVNPLNRKGYIMAMESATAAGALSPADRMVGMLAENMAPFSRWTRLFLGGDNETALGKVFKYINGFIPGDRWLRIWANEAGKFQLQDYLAEIGKAGGPQNLDPKRLAKISSWVEDLVKVPFRGLMDKVKAGSSVVDDVIRAGYETSVATNFRFDPGSYPAFINEHPILRTAFLFKTFPTNQGRLLGRLYDHARKVGGIEGWMPLAKMASAGALLFGGAGATLGLGGRYITREFAEFLHGVEQETEFSAAWLIAESYIRTMGATLYVDTMAPVISNVFGSIAKTHGWPIMEDIARGFGPPGMPMKWKLAELATGPALKPVASAYTVGAAILRPPWDIPGKAKEVLRTGAREIPLGRLVVPKKKKKGGRERIKKALGF